LIASQYRYFSGAQFLSYTLEASPVRKALFSSDLVIITISCLSLSRTFSEFSGSVESYHIPQAKSQRQT
jgi:hypothetical protein